MDAKKRPWADGRLRKSPWLTYLTLASSGDLSRHLIGRMSKCREVHGL